MDGCYGWVLLMVAMGIVCRAAMDIFDVICSVARVNWVIIKVAMGTVQLYAWLLWLFYYVYGNYDHIWSFSCYGYP